MKILLISGSPHKAGTTSVLIKAFSKGAESAGHEVYHFNAGKRRCTHALPVKNVTARYRRACSAMLLMRCGIS